jgi:sporulation protein YlmC with PRC-barrel domain
MLEEAELQSLMGFDVVDRDGKSVGNLEFIFNDADTGRPEWLGVLGGPFRPD